RLKVRKLEHNGDAIVIEVEDGLARTFVTPIDREDIQKLSKELDDILDYTNAAALACDLFGVERPTEPMQKLMDVLVKATSVIKDAMPNLRRHAYPELAAALRLVRPLEKEADTA